MPWILSLFPTADSHDCGHKVDSLTIMQQHDEFSLKTNVGWQMLQNGEVVEIAKVNYHVRIAFQVEHKSLPQSNTTLTRNAPPSTPPVMTSEQLFAHFKPTPIAPSSIPLQASPYEPFARYTPYRSQGTSHLAGDDFCQLLHSPVEEKVTAVDSIPVQRTSPSLRGALGQLTIKLITGLFR